MTFRVAAALLVATVVLAAAGATLAAVESATAPSRAAAARELCGGAFGSRALNSKPVSVSEVRATVPGGPPGRRPPLRHAFPDASKATLAAWCWTGKRHDYSLFAVVQGYRPRLFEGVSGVGYDTHPPPGPAPIP